MSPFIEPGAESPWSTTAVLASIPEHSKYQADTTPIPFFHLLARLKTTKREGWRRFGLNNGESIADHMYRMSVMTMLAPRSLSSRLDVPKCTKMALIHDMAESLVGDLTPVDGVPKTEKSRRERETMDYISTLLAGCGAGEDLTTIWQEYEDGKTLEAQFVKDIDKMELVLQMVEYEKQAEGELDLGEFCWVAERVVLPEMQVWRDAILKERREFWTAVGRRPSGLWEAHT